jgi:hypothetical protein
MRATSKSTRLSLDERVVEIMDKNPGITIYMYVNLGDVFGQQRRTSLQLFSAVPYIQWQLLQFDA